MSDFPLALLIILAEEGGWYPGDQPWDPNPTMHGITQHRYDQYRAAAGLETQTVEAISDGEVETIYLVDYWHPSHADLLSWPLSLFHFDFYVNTTPARATATLQRTVNKVANLKVAVDGVWGPQTEAAVQQLSFAAPRTYLLERMVEYDDIVRGNHLLATPLWQEWLPRLARLYQRYT